MEIEIGSAEDLSLETQVSDLYLLGSDSTSKPCHSLNDVCAGFTKKFRPRSEAAIDREKQRVRQRLIDLRQAHRSELAALLPMEVVASQRARSRFSQQESRLTDALAVLDKELQVTDLNSKYERLDMSFLAQTTWFKTHNCKLPVFAVFDLQNSTCTLTVKTNYHLRPGDSFSREGDEHRYSSQSATPAFVSSLFDYEGLVGLANAALCSAVKKQPQPQPEFESSWSPAYGHYDLNATAEVSARADFAGVIPDSVRSMIRDAMPDFDQILLVAETETWSLGVEVYVKPQPAMIPVGVDPLVIGRRDRSFWLITAFDTTPSEEFVRREYRI